MTKKNAQFNYKHVTSVIFFPINGNMTQNYTGRFEWVFSVPNIKLFLSIFPLKLQLAKKSGNILMDVFNNNVAKFIIEREYFCLYSSWFYFFQKKNATNCGKQFFSYSIFPNRIKGNSNWNAFWYYISLFRIHSSTSFEMSNNKLHQQI